MFEPEFTHEYIDRVMDHPQAYEEEFRQIRDQSHEDRRIYKGEVVPMTYQGFFVGPKQVQLFKKIVTMVSQISRKLTKEFLDNPDFRKGFRMSKEMEDLVLLDPGYKMPAPIGRYDIFYNGGDEFKFNEFNTDGASAMNEDLMIGNLLKGSHIFYEMEAGWKVQPFELFYSLVHSMADHYRKITGQFPKNLAIVDFMDKGTLVEFDKFHDVFEKSGYNCIIADPRTMTYRDGRLYGTDRKSGDQVPIDLVYRRMVTSDFLDRVDQCQDFLQAYKDQAFIMIGSFRSQLLHSKLIFSVLHSDACKEILTDQEWAFVQKHVPKTWPIMNQADKDELLAHKDQYVAKPYNGYGAKGVMIGCEYEQDQWEQKIQALPYDSYCGQEFVSVDRTPFLELGKDGFHVRDMAHVLGLFNYGEKFAGLYCRVGNSYQISDEGQYYTAPSFLVTKK